MNATLSQQPILRLGAAVTLGLFLSSCTTETASHNRERGSRPSLFKSKKHEKEIPCHDEVCKEPEFEAVKIERKISPSLLRPPAGLYRVGPGDVLDIEVAEDIETRSNARVMPDGMLYYNVANGINVKGMTIRQVSDALADSLSYDYVEPVVTVNVAQADSQRFWILGQIQNPGTYPLQRPTTLIAALSQGQGLGVSSVGNDSQETVDLSRAILIRDKKLVPVDFEALIEDGDMSQNVYVHPNDYIYLPSRVSNSVYVLGSVNSPGAIFFDENSSVLSAIAQAGGPNSEAVVTKALIIRGSTTEPEVSVVNLPKLMRGQTPNLKLEPGDIVWLPRSLWTNVRSYTESVLTTAAQTIAIQEGLALLGSSGNAGISIQAGN